jgi:hypothetical protein
LITIEFGALRRDHHGRSAATPNDMGALPASSIAWREFALTTA